MSTYGSRQQSLRRSGGINSQQVATSLRSNARRASTDSTPRALPVVAERQPTPDENTQIVDANSSSEEEDAEEPLQLHSAPKLAVLDSVKRAAEQIPIDDLKRKAAEWARYALACEYQRLPIRGDHVRKEVLVDSKYTRVFSVIFNETQMLLQLTFGYHMVEVRAKGADNAELEKQAETAIREAASQANGLRSRNKEKDTSPDVHQDGRTHTNVWVLRSALPAKIIKNLVKVSDELVNADDASSPTTSQRRENAGQPAINWTSANHQGGEMGLLYIILGIILVNGRTVSDFVLTSCLKRLKLPMYEVLPSALRGTGPAPGVSSSGTQTQTQARQRAKQGTLDGFLAAMVKQSYLEKQRTDLSTDDNRSNPTRKGVRGGARAHDDENTLWEWRWGSRSEAEIGEQRIAAFMVDIFLDPSASNDVSGPTEDESVDAQTRAVDRANLKKRKRILLENIASVAGSQLAE